MVKRNNHYKAERNRKIYEARLSGRTFLDISKEYGVGVERVRQIYLKEKRLEKWRRFNRRNGTYDTIQDLERCKELMDIIAHRYKLKLQEDDERINNAVEDLKQKIDNLIEVYGEEV